MKHMEAKIKLVRNCSKPHTKKQVRASMELCCYYSQFIPSFSTVGLLSELTKKSKENKVIWKRACEKAVNLLEQYMISQPVLTSPDWNKQFILQMDASAMGLSYVSSQLDGHGIEHPVAYVSRKLLLREQNYSTIECKAFAIVQRIRHFQTYL